MILMLDSMAQRYGCLPSDILARGDTIDVEVLVRSVAWHNESQVRNQRGQSMPVQTAHRTEDLKRMMEAARQL
jgi:hypothetical protein